MISRSESRLTQRCPNPACLAIVEQANAYVLQKLAGRLAANYRPLFTSAPYQTVRSQIIEALVAGDVETTKARCREWCKIVIHWTRQDGVAQEAPLPANTAA